jgi:hypothetical protein
LFVFIETENYAKYFKILAKFREEEEEEEI